MIPVTFRSSVLREYSICFFFFFFFTFFSCALTSLFSENQQSAAGWMIDLCIQKHRCTNRPTATDVAGVQIYPHTHTHYYYTCQEACRCTVFTHIAHTLSMSVSFYLSSIMIINMVQPSANTQKPFISTLH